VARNVASRIAAEYISIDRILEQRGLEDEWEAGYISQRSFLRANSFAAEEARRSLDADRPVVIDGNFYWKSQVEDLRLRLAYPHRVFTLRAPLSVCIERDGRRAPSYGAEAAAEVYAKATEFDYGTVLDANRPLGAVVREVLALLPKDASPRRSNRAKA